jgi:hypothetical protein
LDNPAFDEYLPLQRIRKQTKSYNENQIVDAALKDILKPLNSKSGVGLLKTLFSHSISIVVLLQFQRRK